MNDEVIRLFNEGVTASLQAHEARVAGDFEKAQPIEQQAHDFFEQALQIEPDNLGALGGKAMSLTHLGRTPEAVPVFEKAIELEPTMAENHRQVGLCYAELGNLPAARDATRKALELNPEDDYREKAAVELYNFGGHLMQFAAKMRDAGKSVEEKQCIQHAQGLFAIIVDFDPNNEHANQALTIIDRILNAPQNPTPPSDDGKQRIL